MLNREAKTGGVKVAVSLRGKRGADGVAMRRLFVMVLGLFVTVSMAYGQAGTAASADSGLGSNQGRALLREMVQAMGGQQWLDMKNEYNEGRVIGYYQGRPDGSMQMFFDWREPLGPEREEQTKQRNVVELYHGDSCTEVDYKGAHPQVKKICDEYQRRRRHSIEYAVRVWLKQPGTAVEYDGQKLAGDFLADQVTLINEDDDSITILLDDNTHLPREVRYEWRDPVYHDMNKDKVEFSNYRRIDGIATPFTITYNQNGQMTEQRFLFYAAYNVKLPPDGFSVEKTAERIAEKRKHGRR